LTTEPQISWIKLGQKDLELVVARFVEDGNSQAVVIRGDAELSHAQKVTLREAGFVKLKHARTVWARPGNSVVFGEIQAAFPHANARDMPPSAVQFKVSGRSPFSRPVAPVVDPSLTPAPISSTLSIVPDPAKEPVPVLAAPVTPHEAKPSNKFQVEYRPGSKLGSPIAMIPINMAPATQKALAKLEEVHGAIDDFVARRLYISLEEMEKVLSPEQIDAIGLALFATERGREFLLADQTGLGKGRVLAGLALAGLVSGKKVVFITEKANLFSDFWRDLKDIGADKLVGKPFLLNHKSRVIDVTSIGGDVLHLAPEQKELRKIVQSGQLPEGCRFMMATYSQFNRANSPKNGFLASVAEDAFVLVDEAHNAGVASNVGKSLANGLAKAWGILRSSATFARSAGSLLAYPRVLPPSLRTEQAQEFLMASGNATAEVLSEALAEDGVLIRREQDLTGVNIEVAIDHANEERNAYLNDAVSPILTALRKLQRKVEDEIETRNIEIGNPEANPKMPRWYSANFGSRLQPLMRQFMLALSVDHTVELCVNELLEGRKPVVVVEQTMETLMRELAGDSPSFEDDMDPWYPPAEFEIEGDDEDGVVGEIAGPPRPPTFRDALKLMLDRILHMSFKKGKDDPEKIKVEDGYILAEADKIINLIEAIPDISLSPIDDIRDRVEEISRDLVMQGRIEKEWQADEISARSTRVVDGKYVPLAAPDRNDLVVGYNSGRLDLLVLTLAASTGLSLHASERAQDQRRRTMILPQIPSDVTRYVQMLGRVNRRGQTSVPRFIVPSTGLPAQNRTLAKANRKVADLSANVSANAENATEMDVKDFIDSLGNEVAQRMLEEQPRLAERMHIAMKDIDQEVADQELYYVNKILQGMWYLTAQEQNAIFDRLSANYEDALKAMQAKGTSPRGSRELEGSWKEVARRVYEHSNPEDGDVFGRSVDIVTMERFIERDPLSSERVREALLAARRRLGDASGNAVGPYFESQQKLIKKNRPNILLGAMTSRMVSVPVALKDKEDNAVKRADAKLTALSELLTMLSPGTVIHVATEDGDRKSGIVTDIYPPEDLADMHIPGRWTVSYALPGDVHIRAVSLQTIMRDKSYDIRPTRGSDELNPDLSYFDRADKRIRDTRDFLMGNLVKGIAIANEMKAGSMVTWFDEAGDRQRSILINKTSMNSLLDRSSKTKDLEKAKEVLMGRSPLFSNPLDRGKGLIVEKINKGFQVRLPVTKEGQVVTPADIKDFCQTFRTERKEQLAYVSDMQIENLLRYVFSKDISLHYDMQLSAPKPANSQARPSFGGPRRPAFGGAR
jgi:hypothetical protein